MNRKDNLSFEIAMLIRELDSSIYNTLLSELKEFNLTPQQLTVMKLIGHNGEMTVSQICEAMSLTKGTVSGILNRMEKLDYVKKVKYEEDKRNTYISFSTKGIEFARKFRVNFNNAFENLFKDIDDEQLKEMKKSLENIVQTIKRRD